MNETTNSNTVCYRHPDRKTNLRCNRCEKPMCPDCAVLTPTGYRCKDCVRSQQKVFDTAQPQDYVFGILIALFLGYLGGFISRYIGFFIIFIAPAAGVVIAEAVRMVIKRRRSKSLFRAVTGAAILGALINAVPTLLGLLFGSFNILGLVWTGVYIAFMTSSLYYRLSGIQIRR